MCRNIGFMALIPFLCVLVCFGEGAAQQSYTEDFTTMTYKDELNTTSRWDTVSGELNLYPFVPTLAGSYDTPGEAAGVAISGDHAYVADGLSGLQVIDMSDPAAPTLVGSYVTADIALGVAVSGDHAYVADRVSGLQVIDVSDPTAPTLAGSCATLDFAQDVSISGDHAYVADGSSGLQVIDISDPTTPVLVGSYDTPGAALDVAVSGNYAYVADARPGFLQVIDISDPTAPTFAGSYVTADMAVGVAISGDHAYVADRYSGLQVIDISDPTAPTLAGTYDTPDQARAVAISGDHAYVTDRNSGLLVIDISDPTTPTLTGSYDTPDLANGVAVAGDHAYVADYASGLQVIEIGEPVAPTLVGRYIPPEVLPYGVAVSGDHAYVADRGFGLAVVDVSDPSVPTLVGSFDTQGAAYGVAISGDHAYVADADSGLSVIDISDPTVPTLAGSCDTPGTARGVAVSGDHAYVADWLLGLQVIDISDPTAPSLVGSHNTPGLAWEVAVSGDHAYVADLSGGLQVVDISDPTAPVLAGYFDTQGAAYGVAISGDHAYVADTISGLHVLDISDPTAPTIVGSYGAPGESNSVAISGDYACVTYSYVEGGFYGLRVLDISDPTAPTLVGSHERQNNVHVAISGDHAYVVGQPGLSVFQVFQHVFDADRNVGQSLAVSDASRTVLGARLTTTQTATVTWELSADGGVNWDDVLPDRQWTRATVPGTALMWRSTHEPTSPGVNPTVSDLEIEWLGEAAQIASIVDVPDDQGGWLRVGLTPSGYDFVEETVLPVTGYQIYQRVDAATMRSATEDELLSPETANALGSFDANAVRMVNGRAYIDGDMMAAGGFPSGIWEAVGWVAATQRDDYIVRVPTVADSIAAGVVWSSYFVTTHTTTPSIWFASEPDSAYSVDNLMPDVPTGLMVSYGPTNTLTWQASSAPDFAWFNIYRISPAASASSTSIPVHSTVDLSWVDEQGSWGDEYLLSVVDDAGNESDLASPTSVTAVNDAPVQRVTALVGCSPNPFNPRTTITYSLGTAGHAELAVYDLAGRRVKVLVAGHVTAGDHEVSWDGRDESGRRVASGVYLYRLRAEEYVETKRMVLVK